MELIVLTRFGYVDVTTIWKGIKKMNPEKFDIYFPELHYFGTAHGKSQKAKRKWRRKQLLEIWKWLDLLAEN